MHVKFGRDNMMTILIELELLGSANIRSELPLSLGRPSCKGFHQPRDRDSRGSIEAPP